MTRDAALRCLQTTFGYRAFRGQQADIIHEVLQGRDALVLMPTGGGKSLCYQIPALLRPGVGIVVSPLIALMQDQVDALRQLGISAAFLNSSLSAAQLKSTEAQLLRGELDLLYVAPERLLSARLLELLSRLNLALFAIDEAHCVSRWGHDFRPEYLQLGVLAERFARVPRLALTATADALTRKEIVAQLKLGGAKQFIASFDRPNIRYRVVTKENPKQQLLAFYQAEHQGDAGIVYCLSRQKVEDTAHWLRQRGVTALPYHAGLVSAVRQQHQERFLREDGVVMVATIAFGMGIDKPDVRFVAHLELPKSLEGYYQETGRAGRDGLPANAFMTYGLADVLTHRKLLERSSADAAFKRLEQQKLEALLGYCETARCRRQVLLAYFGEASDPCDNCDTCLYPVATYDATVHAQKLLSTVVRTHARFGAGHLIDILLGKPSARVRALGHDRLSTFGIGQDLSQKQWRSVVRQLVASGYLSMDEAGYGSLKLTAKSLPILTGKEQLELRQDATPQPTHKQAPSPQDADQQLFAALRELRAKLAKAHNVPAYVIFHDATLRQMATEKPRSPAAFAQLSGVGQHKLERYAEAFLQVIAEHPD
jgi:ATP-dependent DNA helicase RecQ